MDTSEEVEEAILQLGYVVQQGKSAQQVLDDDTDGRMGQRNRDEMKLMVAQGKHADHLRHLIRTKEAFRTTKGLEWMFKRYRELTNPRPRIFSVDESRWIDL